MGKLGDSEPLLAASEDHGWRPDLGTGLRQDEGRGILDRSPCRFRIGRKYYLVISAGGPALRKPQLTGGCAVPTDALFSSLG